MGANSKIAWTHHTFNPWIGCVKVSDGCVNCYAEQRAKRFGWNVWGANHPRRTLSKEYWRAPHRWNRDAERTGEQRLVMCGSMCDVLESSDNLDNQAALNFERAKLWELIRQTPRLTWLLITKRTENIAASCVAECVCGCAWFVLRAIT
jgi:protein gp37